MAEAGSSQAPGIDEAQGPDMAYPQHPLEAFLANKHQPNPPLEASFFKQARILLATFASFAKDPRHFATLGQNATVTEAVSGELELVYKLGLSSEEVRYLETRR